RLVRPYPVVVGRAGAARSERQTDRPADRAQADIHRADPVDAVTDRICSCEVGDLVDDFTRVDLARCEPERLAERKEMLAPPELPRQLDVALRGPHRVGIPAPVREPAWESHAANRIE